MTSELTTHRLGDLLDAVIDHRGRTPKKLGGDFATSGVRVISAKNVKDGRLQGLDECRFISESMFEAWMPTRLRVGDVLLTSEAPLGEVAYLRNDANFCLGQRLFALRADESRLDGRFLSYLLRSPAVRHRILARATGTTAQGIRQAELVRVELDIPPLSEQQRIATILGALDDKIELNHRMNRTLESIARAIFKSWFVDFDPVRRKMEGKEGGEGGLPPEHSQSFPSCFGPSSLGPIPYGWQVASVGALASELEAGSRPRGGVSDVVEGIPSIGAESIVGIGQFDYAKTKRVPREFWAAMTRGWIKSRDVLVYKDGGRPGMFEPHVTLVGDGFPFEECSINEHVYRLRVLSTLSQTYVYFWLSSDLAMGEMRERGTGVAIPSLNSTAFRSVPVLVPDSTAVGCFTAAVEPLVARILTNARQSRTLQQTRDTLLPRLLSSGMRTCDVDWVVDEVREGVL